MNFPQNPQLNKEYTYAGKTWEWDGEKWNIIWDHVGFLTEDPIITDQNSYMDNIQTIMFDPNDLPQITKK
jgi:hypothetical protein